MDNPSTRPFQGTIGTPVDRAAGSTPTPTPTPPVMDELLAAKHRLLDSLALPYANMLRDIPPDVLFRMRAMGAWPIFESGSTRRVFNTTDGGIRHESLEEVERRTGIRHPDHDAIIGLETQGRPMGMTREEYDAREHKRDRAREMDAEVARIQEEARRAQAPQGLDRLLAERGKDYGDAWLLTGDIFKLIGSMRLTRLVGSGFMYNWSEMLCRLIRALTSPYKRDHWADIEGYAHLVITKIDRDTNEG